MDAAAFDAPKRGPVSRKADRNVQGRLTTTPGGRSKSRDPGASPCAMGIECADGDEVICGFGRTGNWWGSNTFKLQPDMLTCAKPPSAA